jgi:nicotinamide mononucleotide transporter
MSQVKRSDTIFLWSFLTVGLAVQLVTYIISPQSVISLVSGMFGICSVVLCSQGRILTYIFGFGQIITYTYICYTDSLYGLIGINIFYFITQIYGIIIWRKRLYANKSEFMDAVPTRKVSWKMMVAIAVSVLALSALVGWLLATFTDDSQPYLDAYTTIPALIAQILMILAYREQWYIWFFIDVLYVVLWARAGNYCLVAQHIFWCINCVYGFYRWTKALEPHA